MLSRNARVAGILYLAVVLISPIRLIYIPSVLFVSGNAAATANNIAAHELLFSIGIFADLLNATLEIFLVLALYRLLNPVHRTLATIMVILGLADVPIFFLNTLNDIGALQFSLGANYLSAFGHAQQDAMVMVFLHLHHYGIVINEIFWGLWLLPFGFLVYKSDFLPRVLGVLLMVNCFAYLAQNFTGIVLPESAEFISNVMFPFQFGEVAIMLWLIIMGAKVKDPGSRLKSV